MRFHVFIRTPGRQGLLGPIPGKMEHSEREAESRAKLVDALVVPIGGWACVCPVEDATMIRSRVVNEVSP